MAVINTIAHFIAFPLSFSAWPSSCCELPDLAGCFAVPADGIDSPVIHRVYGQFFEAKLRCDSVSLEYAWAGCAEVDVVGCRICARRPG